MKCKKLIITLIILTSLVLIWFRYFKVSTVSEVLNLSHDISFEKLDVRSTIFNWGAEGFKNEEYEINSEEDMKKVVEYLGQYKVRRMYSKAGIVVQENRTYDLGLYFKAQGSSNITMPIYISINGSEHISISRWGGESKRYKIVGDKIDYEYLKTILEK